MKVFNWFFIVVFVIFAGLQYNDPDPYLWVPIYLYAALLCWLAIRQKFIPAMYWIGFLVYAVYALYKAFDTNGMVDSIRNHHAQNIAGTMKAETPWVEETREFFGLVIILAVLRTNYVYLNKLKKRSQL